MKDVSFGVSLNNRATVFLPDYPVGRMLDLAVQAEESGFDQLWVHDSLLDSPRPEPLTILGAVAARTKEARIGASIIQPHFRKPVQFALAWATLDIISSGRTILALGIGGGSPEGVARECRAVGVEANKRGEILEETVVLLRRLWSEDGVTYSGMGFKLENASLGVKPIQRPHPPIWIAAGIYVPADAVKTAIPGYYSRREAGRFIGRFDRVGRLADGWFTIMATADEYRGALDEVKRHARESGRDQHSIHPAVELWVKIDTNAEKARSELHWFMEQYHGGPVSIETVNRWGVFGTSTECVKKIQSYIEAGAKTIKIVLASHDQFAELKQVARDILPSF